MCEAHNEHYGRKLWVELTCFLFACFIMCTCTINGNITAWYSPSYNSPVATVITSGDVRNVNNTRFTAAFVSNYSGLTTTLSFTATTDNNET